MYICQSQSHSIPHSSHSLFSSLVSIHLFSTSVALLLPCKLCSDLNDKEIQKRGVYECMLLIHLSVQQKLIQHCKANKPELKKENKKKKQHSVQCTCLSISDAVRYYAIFKYKELMSYRPSNSMCYKDPSFISKTWQGLLWRLVQHFLCCFVDLAFKSIFLQTWDLPGCEMYHSVYTVC